MNLMRLSGSSQEADIRSGKAPSDIFGDVARVKTYCKFQDVGWSVHPRLLEFDQPYQFVSSRLGCSWTEGNVAVVFQAAGCNLQCDYCYVGDDWEGVEVDSESMVEVYRQYCEIAEKSSGIVSRVVRISGGEPFLQQDELTQVIRAAWPENVVLWIDTNLTRLPSSDLVRAMKAGPGGSGPERLAVCGCFKPGTADLESQAEVARHIIESGIECFFYWPCTIDSLDDLRQKSVRSWRARALGACRLLAQAVDINAPLRTTFIRIKYYYNTIKAKGISSTYYDEQAKLICRTMRSTQAQFVEQNYPSDLYWQPSHMIPFAGSCVPSGND